MKKIEVRKLSRYVPLTPRQFRERFFERFSDPAFDAVKAELEDRQAGLRGDRDAHRVAELEAAHRREPLLREEKQGQFLQLGAVRKERQARPERVIHVVIAQNSPAPPVGQPAHSVK